MKIIFAFTSLTFLLVSVSSKEPNACLYASTKHLWDIGESYNPPGECVNLKCLGKNQFSVKTCPSFGAKNCKLVPQDNSKPYPDCCPKWKCEEKN